MFVTVISPRTVLGPRIVVVVVVVVETVVLKAVPFYGCGRTYDNVVIKDFF